MADSITIILASLTFTATLIVILTSFLILLVIISLLFTTTIVSINIEVILSNISLHIGLLCFWFLLILRFFSPLPPHFHHPLINLYLHHQIKKLPFLVTLLHLRIYSQFHQSSLFYILVLLKLSLALGSNSIIHELNLKFLH